MAPAPSNPRFHGRNSSSGSSPYLAFRDIHAHALSELISEEPTNEPYPTTSVRERVIAVMKTALERGYTAEQLREWIQGAIDMNDPVGTQEQAEGKA